jgi:hypothetical protein
MHTYAHLCTSYTHIHITDSVHTCVWMNTQELSRTHTNIYEHMHLDALTHGRTHALARSLTQAMMIAMLSGLCLGYTLLTLPFSLAFLWIIPLCDGVPTQKVDMFVDIFFLLEIVMTFFTGTRRLRFFSLLRDLDAACHCVHSVVTLSAFDASACAVSACFSADGVCVCVEMLACVC